MQLSASITSRGHEVRILEHAKVLHDAEAGHLRQCLDELAEGLAVLLAKPIQQRPPMRIGEGPECRLQLFHHAPDYM